MSKLLNNSITGLNALITAGGVGFIIYPGAASLTGLPPERIAVEPDKATDWTPADDEEVNLHFRRADVLALAQKPMRGGRLTDEDGHEYEIRECGLSAPGPLVTIRCRVIPLE